MRNWKRHLDSSRNVVLLCLKLDQRFFRSSGTLKLGFCLIRDLGDMILFLMHRNNQRV